MVAAEEVQIDDRVKAVLEAEAAAKAETDGKRQGRSSSRVVGVTHSWNCLSCTAAYCCNTRILVGEECAVYDTSSLCYTSYNSTALGSGGFIHTLKPSCRYEYRAE